MRALQTQPFIFLSPSAVTSSCFIQFIVVINSESVYTIVHKRLLVQSCICISVCFTSGGHKIRRNTKKIHSWLPHISPHHSQDKVNSTRFLSSHRGSQPNSQTYFFPSLNRITMQCDAKHWSPFQIHYKFSFPNASFYCLVLPLKMFGLGLTWIKLLFQGVCPFQGNSLTR